MKKIICKKEYDTETATLVKKYTYSYYGDPAGYEETLYVYFLTKVAVSVSYSFLQMIFFIDDNLLSFA